MSQDPQSAPPIFSQINTELRTDTATHPEMPEIGLEDIAGLLHQMVIAQERQNELIEDLVDQMGAAQRQRANELGQWKRANPELAVRCRRAAESLSRVQAQFLENMTNDIEEAADALEESDFMLNEFVDRYGPRLAHLNGVLQVLSQLSCPPQPAADHSH